MQHVAKVLGIVCNANGIYEEFAYFGDDIIDIPCMKLSGISGAPANAVKNVIEMVNFVCEKQGGNGAAREFVEWLLNYN